MKTLNIIGKRKIFFTISALLAIASLVSLIIFGLKPGIDFVGGSLLEINFSSQRPTIEEMKNSLITTGLSDIENAKIQPAEENSFILRTRSLAEEEHQKILSQLREDFENQKNEEGINIENKVLEQRQETIGSSISSELRSKSFKTITLVIIMMIVYITWAFKRVSKPIKSWKYGVTAIIALVHDVLITIGVFSILGHFYNVEVDIAFIVAILTILGYSVNDTIVVFDRVRENLIKFGYENFEETVNKGVNETLARSINTSLTTLLVLIALYFYGGASIHYFVLALIIGITLGALSSIFLASPLLVVWDNWSRRKK
ncbi:MAG: protein translocase subunit SecF [Patescibacteria group bacterium]